MRLFFTSKSDPRRLSMLAHEIAKQHPGRREHIYGKVHAMDCDCKACREAA